MQYLGVFFLAFACHQPPFSQRSVRQAFARAINRRELVQEVWANAQRPALGGMIPPGMPGHTPELTQGHGSHGWSEPPQQAVLVQQLKRPPIVLGALPGYGSTPAYLQRCWRDQLEVEVQLHEDMAIDELMAQLADGSIHGALLGWNMEYPDPDNILRVLFHSASPINYFGWKHKRYDELVERAASLADQRERLALYHEADRILVAEEVAVVPLYYPQAYGLLRPGFHIAGSQRIIRGGTFRLKDVLARPGTPGT